MTKLLGYQQGMIDDPNQGLAPIRSNALEGINRRYAGSGDRVSTQLAKRGYTGSGKLPGAFVNLERSRLADMSGLESDFARIASDRQSGAANSIQQILASMRGTSNTGSFTQPGMSGLSAAGDVLGNVSKLLGFLKGGNEKSEQSGYDSQSGEAWGR